MYCKKCGKEISDDSAFCTICGADQTIILEGKQHQNATGAKKIIEELGGVVGTAAIEVAKEIVSDGINTSSKALKKKGGKVVHKGLVKIGLQKETVGDKAGKAFRGIKKRIKK